MLLKLFSDAELAEDLAEDFVGGDFAGDGAEGGEGGAEVLREEVGRESAVESVADGGEGRGGLAKGDGVTRVGHQSTACGSNSGPLDKGISQIFEPGTRFCGDFQQLNTIRFIFK